MVDKNNQMDSMTEIAIAMDINARMAIYCMAKLCGKEEIEDVMCDIKAVLSSGNSYPKETLDAMFKVYTEGTVAMSAAIDQIREQQTHDDDLAGSSQ